MAWHAVSIARNLKLRAYLCSCVSSLLRCFSFVFALRRMISAWDTFFEVDDYYTYKKPVGHGAYGVVISALDTRDNSKVS